MTTIHKDNSASVRAHQANAKARRDEIKKIIVESFYSHPWLVLRDRSVMLGVGELAIRKVVAESPVLDCVRMRDVRRVVGEIPYPTPRAVADALGIASPRPVGLLLTKYDPELYARLSRNRDNQTAQREYSQKKALGKIGPFDAADAPKLVAAVADALKRNPFHSLTLVQQEMKVPRYIVDSAVNMLAHERFDRALEREIRLAEFIEAYPNANLDDAAKYFKANPQRIRQTRGSAALRPAPPKPRYANQPGSASESGWDNSDLDAQMEANLCLRPAWYVEEVYERGGLGVELPEVEFNRYLALYEKKRNGKKLYTVGADNHIHWRKE